MATSKFIRAIRDNLGVPLEDLFVYLVPSGQAFNTDMPLTEHATRKGYYTRNQVPDGEYDLWIDSGGGAALYESNIWHGEKVISNIANAMQNDNTDYNVSITKHGLMPKLPDDETKFFNGKGEYVTPPSTSGVDTTLDFVWTGKHTFSKTIQLGNALRTDINTNPFQVDVSNCSLLILNPKVDTSLIIIGHLPTQILMVVNRGSFKITWSATIVIPAGGTAFLVYNQVDNTWYVTNVMVDIQKAMNQDVTTFNASSTKHGLLPKLPNDPAKFLNGVGEFVEIAGMSIGALVPLIIGSWLRLYAFNFDVSGIVLAL